MEETSVLNLAADLTVVERRGKRHLLFSCPETAETLKKMNVYPIGLGIDPSDKKNVTAKRSPFILGELATLYVAFK